MQRLALNLSQMEPSQRRLVVGIVRAGVAVLVQCTAEENPGAGLTPST